MSVSDKRIRLFPFLLLCGLLWLFLLSGCTAAGPDQANPETKAEESAAQTNLETAESGAEGLRIVSSSTVDPDCEHAGYTLYVLEDGSEEIKEYRMPTGHSFAPVSSASPGCEEPGSILYECQNGCGLRYQRQTEPPLGHDEVVAVIEPTCLSSGYTLHTCTRCNWQMTDEITPPAEHDFETQTEEATCTRSGYTRLVCRTCGLVRSESILEPTGHAFETHTHPATCTEPGQTVQVCPDCHLTLLLSSAEPLGHLYKGETVPPTCTAAGYTKYTCERCNASYTGDETPPAGHRYETTVVPPDCTNEGYTLYTCRECGETRKADFVPATGHSLTEQTTPPSCTEEGEVLVVCRNCKQELSRETIPPTGHSYTLSATPPTTEKNGSIVHTCSRCGDTHTTTVTPDMVFTRIDSGYSPIALQGVDLSSHNGDVDFAALREAGISFVLLKMGSSHKKDAKFEANYSAAKEAGLRIGCYFYTYASTPEEARLDVELSLGWLADKELSYPVFYDMEEETQEGLGKTTTTEIIRTYLDGMIEQGYYTGLYTNKKWLYEKLFDVEEITSRYCIWFASWTTSGLPDQDYRSLTPLWQYASGADCPGVSTGTDLDVCWFDFPTFLQTYGFNQIKKTPV